MITNSDHIKQLLLYCNYLGCLAAVSCSLWAMGGWIGVLVDGQAGLCMGGAWHGARVGDVRHVCTTWIVRLELGIRGDIDGDGE